MTDSHNYPTPGPNEPVPPWDEYNQLREAVYNYLDHDPDDPAWDDIWRALGAITGELQRDAFVQAFELTEPAEQACIRRLITGDDECPHSPLEPDSDPIGPPHSPPADDHATLWLDDGEPELYSMHVYPGNIERLDSREPPHNLWFDVFKFAAEWGLEVSVLRSLGIVLDRQYRSCSIRQNATDLNPDSRRQGVDFNSVPAADKPATAI